MESCYTCAGPADHSEAACQGYYECFQCEREYCDGWSHYDHCNTCGEHDCDGYECEFEQIARERERSPFPADMFDARRRKRKSR